MSAPVNLVCCRALQLGGATCGAHVVVRIRYTPAAALAVNGNLSRSRYLVEFSLWSEPAGRTAGARGASRAVERTSRQR